MQNSAFKPKKRKCPICGERYIPCNPAQSCCFNSACALEKGRRNSAKKQRAQAKQERQDVAVRREKLKSRSDYLKEAQIEFNRFIRCRDANLPCISCGRNSGAKVNAGHFLSVGAHPQLRFNEKNVHLQCEHCNTYLSGNIHQYRPRLVEKIGLQAVEALESDQTIQKWSIDELRSIKQEYKGKLKALLKSRENTSPP